jgi:hypothetical protein
MSGCCKADRTVSAGSYGSDTLRCVGGQWELLIVGWIGNGLYFGILQCRSLHNAQLFVQNLSLFFLIR